MGSMKKWMLAAVLAAGLVGMSATPAEAARVGFYVGAPAYSTRVWVGGYWANGYWVPGYWSYGPGYGGGIVIGPGYYGHYGRYHHRW